MTREGAIVLLVTIIAVGIPRNVPAAPGRPTQAQVDRALAKADRTIRDGVLRLSRTYPDLRVTDAGPLAKALHTVDPQPRHGLNLWISHYSSMAPPRPESEAAKHGFLVTVILQDPKSFPADEQMVPESIYPALGLAGRVSSHAQNHKLDAALDKLVTGALAPVGRLEKQAERAAVRAPSPVSE